MNVPNILWPLIPLLMVYVISKLLLLQTSWQWTLRYKYLRVHLSITFPFDKFPEVRLGRKICTFPTLMAIVNSSSKWYKSARSFTSSLKIYMYIYNVDNKKEKTLSRLFSPCFPRTWLPYWECPQGTQVHFNHCIWNKQNQLESLACGFAHI